MKKLYIFTGKFPYTIVTESFMEEEIKYLSNKFDQVFIIPLQKEVLEQKKLPDNCSIIEPVLENRFLSILRGIFNLKVAGYMCGEFFDKSVYKDRVKLLNWVKCYFIANNLLNNRHIKKIGNELKVNDVCYFYWGKWSNLLSFFWKGKSRMVSRFHGEFDLWEEVHHGYVPLREKVVESLDSAVFISAKGEDYFKRKYPSCNTHFIPLGSINISTRPWNHSDSIRVLSCSNVIPLKRVDLIYRSLLEVNDKRIEWVHIGDGSNMNVLRGLIQNETAVNVHVELKGAMKHEEVVQYYGEHTFDVFVNLSTNEGVPVSIMEAISCNIPVVATDVGGTSEVVTKETGILVNANPSPKEVACAIVEVVNAQLDPRCFWERKYNADKNYQAFANYLYTL